jgi:hypothetical protein
MIMTKLGFRKGQGPKTTKVKKKERSLSAFKDDAWKAFSRLIRRRDCLITTLTPDYGHCVTCGKMFPFEKLQAGHYIQGRKNGVLFNEANVHAQCVGCNMFKNGNLNRYVYFMQDVYGQDTIDYLTARDNADVTYTREELVQMRDEFIRREKEIEVNSFINDQREKYLKALSRFTKETA